MSRASLYRRRRLAADGPAVNAEQAARQAEKTERVPPPNVLSGQEIENLKTVLTSPEFAGKAPRQVWASLLDRGIYLASVSTMYRVLRAAGLAGERRPQAAHPAKKKPELVARRPNEVRSWDITKLRGPLRGQFFDLYVMIDIFSRMAVHTPRKRTARADIAWLTLSSHDGLRAVACSGGRCSRLSPSVLSRSRPPAGRNRPPARVAAVHRDKWRAKPGHLGADGGRV